VRVHVPGGAFQVQISPAFISACEPGTIEVVGLSSETPAVIGAEVQGSSIAIRIEGALPARIVVKLSGTRRDRDVVMPPQMRAPGAPKRGKPAKKKAAAAPRGAASRRAMPKKAPRAKKAARKKAGRKKR
jgi:hypothetical protein